MTLASIPDVIAAVRAGKPVIVADDEDRENEGDAILSAELASQEWIAWMVRNTSGFLCAPMPNTVADRLDLPLMTTRNEDARQTAYTITVDAADRVSTGISASDRAHTLRVLASPGATPASVIRPGHVVPLRARDGGVRERGGHTEAGVDLMRLAGLSPVAVIGELVADDGEMMRLPTLIELGERENLPVTTVAAIIEWLDAHEPQPPRAETAATGSFAASPADVDSATAPDAASAPSPWAQRVLFEVETTVPTRHGPMRMRAYRDRATGSDHLAVIAGDLGTDDVLVRVHSECLTGEAFGSLKCECGAQLDTALDTIARDGGAVIYLRGHEGRGIGLVNKLRAYRLQEDGLDTLDANLALDLPADSRDYTAAAAILDDLGVRSVHLLTNNPEKGRQLERHGITVSERIPLIVGLGAFNEHYMATKRDRMGHQLDDAPTSVTSSEAPTRAVGSADAASDDLLKGHTR